jgi:flagellar protein FliO/FliZ
LIELVIRLAFSLAVVLGLLILLARVSAKRFRGSTDAPIRVVHRQALSRGSAVAVVSVGSRVLVVGTTDQQVSLLTELDPTEVPELTIADQPGVDADFEAELQAVLDAGLEAGLDAGLENGRRTGLVSGPAPAVEPRRDVRPAGAHKRTRTAVSGRAVRATTASQGVLAGSALSAQTWRQALAVATRREQDAS